MKRYAVYARFSSDNQNEKSVEDQVNECKAYIQNNKGVLADHHIFTDYAISGSHINTRPGLLALMEAAKQGAFDVVMADDLSRLSRDQEDIAGIYKRLVFQDIELRTIFDGEINEMQIGFKGTENAMYLKRLAHQVRRGQKGKVSAGKIPGGNCYGYDVVRRFGEDGQPIKGLRTINEEQAAIICRIFKEYISGTSPRAIVHQLNKEGIPGPRGGQWRPSTLNGNPKRRNGILNNELYIGRIVYNRQRFVKDPETGKRQAKPNPEKEWVVQEVPELRILTDEQWEAAQERRAFIARNFSSPVIRKSYLLSGLLKCHCCGGSFVITGGSRKGSGPRYGCSTRKEKGTCNNRATITVEKLEERVFNGLKTYLKDPAGLNLFIREFHKNLREIKAESAKEEAIIQKALKQTDQKIQSVIKAIEDGLYSQELKERMLQLEAEKEKLQGQLQQLSQDNERVFEFLPNLGMVYERNIDDLRQSLRYEETRSSAIELLRSLIDKVVLKPSETKGVDIEIEGRLAAILHYLQGNTQPLRKELAPDVSRSMVAEGCNIPNRAGYVSRPMVAGGCNIPNRACKTLSISA